MKVYLQYKYGTKDSPQFQYLLKHPPTGIEYLNWKRGRDTVTSANALTRMNTSKHGIRYIIMKLNLPIPNVSFITSRFQFDLIHAINTIPITMKPFVVEFEMFWQPFLCSANNKFAQKIVKFLLKRKNCRAITVWSELTKKHLLTLFDDDIEIAKKINVIYPAVPLQKSNSQHKKLTIGFIGRYFYEKGGDVALKVMEKCPDLNGIVVSTIPKDVKIPSNVKVYDLLSREKLLKDIYPNIDLMLYPGFSDSFGFIFLESMSFGIPILTVNGYSRVEIVVPDENGFVMNSILDKWGHYSLSNDDMYFVNRLIGAVAVLAKDKKLYKKISDANYKCIKNGRFSVKVRNDKLFDMYQEALIWE
jgi:glycosyltransferase involved in cell wall biosynthesis